VTGAAVLAVGLAAVVVVPHGTDAPSAPTALPGAASAAAEREVLTVDAAPVSAALTVRSASLASTGTASLLVAAPVAMHPVLRPGVHGPAVAWVQKRLHVRATGFYGSRTLAAVVAFQKAHHLPAKGYIGHATWKALTARAVGTKAASTARRATSVRRTTTVVRAASAPPVVSGRICPAPGASFGDGWQVQRTGHLHQGQDLMGRKGMPILAVESGYVMRQGRQGNGALTITMQGVSGSKFFYGHMEKNLVKAGQHVKRGQLIGLMGDTGSPGAVHLHFEYWKSGGESAAVNPAPLLHALCG
jgi:murein DD-endopeptidase MepM/ murein hydrolase activator NlpD